MNNETTVNQSINRALKQGLAMNKNKVIASKYEVCNGQILLELVVLGRGRYIIARNGQIDDARRKLTRAEAAEALIGMRITVGSGEDRDSGTVDRIDGESAVVRWDSLVTTPCPLAKIL